MIVNTKKNKYLKFPNRITLELTNNCNLNCVFCPRHNNNQNLGFMQTKLFEKCIDEMAGNLPLTLVPFFRGESLLHPEFINLIRYAKQKMIEPIQLATNAVLLDEKMSIDILESGLDFISFSIALNKKQYENSRGGAKYIKVTENVERFIELRKSRGKSLPEIQVSAVDLETKCVEKGKFVKYWLEKVDRVRIYVEHSNDGKLGSLDYGFQIVG